MAREIFQATVLRCDRCGSTQQFKAEESQSEWTSISFAGENDARDVCPECSRLFARWWEGARPQESKRAG